MSADHRAEKPRSPASHPLTRRPFALGSCLPGAELSPVVSHTPSRAAAPKNHESLPGALATTLRLMGRTFMMKRMLLGLALSGVIRVWGAALPQEYEQIKDEAEKEYANASFSRA